MKNGNNKNYATEIAFRFYFLRSRLLAADIYVYSFYSITDVDESDEHLNNESNNTMISQNITRDSDGLIVPKKLVNPCLQSTDRQNLHRELLFNQKM